jgi:hypothetical protein
MTRLITDAEDWRYTLPSREYISRQFVWEPDDGMSGRRARLTVYEDDGAGGWEGVMGATFNAETIAELGDYFTRLAAHLEGKEH